MNTPPRQLTTPRLRLDVWTAADAPELRSAIDVSDAHLRPWIPFMQHEPRSLSATAQRLVEIEREFVNGEHVRYAIRDLVTSTLVGETMLLDRGGPRTRELGYWLHKDHCGRGYASEANAVLLPFAFSHLDADRVIVRCDERNEASLRVARRLGASLIGHEDLVEAGVAVRLVVLAIGPPPRH